MSILETNPKSQLGKPASPRGNDVLTFFARYMADQGIPPTINEVAEALGMSNSTAYDHMLTLIERGHLIRTSSEGRLSRCVELPNRAKIDLETTVARVKQFIRKLKSPLPSDELETELERVIRCVPIDTRTPQ